MEKEERIACVKHGLEYLQDIEDMVEKVFNSKHQILGIAHYHILTNCLWEAREILETLEEKVCPDCLLEYCECEELEDL